MPNRMLRDWTRCAGIAALSGLAERFYMRLYIKADDHGLYPADTRTLKIDLFPLVPDTIKDAEIVKWLLECQKAGLVMVYESENKQYLQIRDFKQRTDRSNPKYPLPNEDQPLTIVNEPDTIVNDKKKQVKEPEVPDEKYSEEQKTGFKNFQTYIERYAANVAKLKEPFKIEEYLKLKDSYPLKHITDMLLRMHNWKDLTKKNVSAYLTFTNWSRDDKNKAGVDTTNKPDLSAAVKAIENGVKPG